ncbi:neo-calmodulin-like isoform X8 [Bolinopsis microptera]|uniref:neo-calmodulin-like isoform X8 n=1 Tax=Bolinopsis microptera TaxID=2820187 RepID=UPI00307992F6
MSIQTALHPTSVVARNPLMEDFLVMKRTPLMKDMILPMDDIIEIPKDMILPMDDIEIPMHELDVELVRTQAFMYVHKDPDYERRVQDYTAAFQGMDNDGDGTITFEEFKQLWVKSGFLSNEGDIRILFNQVDVNGDGTISLKEFIELNERYAMPSTEEEIREAFKVFDKDNDGFITSDELKRILTKFGGEALEEAEADEIISYIDTNGDEKIHYEEFLVAMEDCNYMAESNSEVESDIEGEDHDHD